MKKVIIDMKSWKDRESAHESLKEELGFPDWYGKNADALYDLLTEGDYSIVLCNAGNRQGGHGEGTGPAAEGHAGRGRPRQGV